MLNFNREYIRILLLNTNSNIITTTTATTINVCSNNDNTFKLK